MLAASVSVSTRRLSTNWACRQFNARLINRSRTFTNSIKRNSSATPIASSHSDASSSSSTSFSDGSIDFGSTRVPVAQKQELVHDVFARVATSYDLMNDAMSMGIHRIWKAALVSKLSPDGTTKHLDVAGGTGDIAFRMLEAALEAGLPPAYRGDSQRNINLLEEQAARAEYSRRAQVVVCDINDNMLRVGIDRAKAQYHYQPGELISPAVVVPAQGATAAVTEKLDPFNLYRSHGQLCFVSGNAESLPFADNSFDSYSIVFGLRNVTHRDRALQEALRVLKPGGRFVCMEFSKVVLPLFDRVYDSYSQAIIPKLGELLANDRESYQYLVDSIRMMPNQEALLGMLKNAGFQAARYDNLSAGIVAVHEGFKALK